MKKPYAWITAALVSALGGTAFAQQTTDQPGGTTPGSEQEQGQGQEVEPGQGAQQPQGQGAEPQPGQTEDQGAPMQDDTQAVPPGDTQGGAIEQPDAEEQQQQLQQQRQEEQELQQGDQGAGMQPGATDMEQPTGVEEQEQQGQQQAQGAQGRLSQIRQQGVNLSALDEQQVMDLQRSLQTAGYYLGEVDGKAGPGTKQALRRFYSDQAQLAAQGVILPEGAAALGLDQAEIERVRGEDKQQQKQKPSGAMEHDSMEQEPMQEEQQPAQPETMPQP